MMMSLVSIIIPVYNAEKYIEKCIKSCFRQDYENLEIIAINDGSTDNSYTILNNLASKNKKLKLFSKKNEGVVIARKVGLSISTGKYIMFVDADDFINETLISTLYEVIEKSYVPFVISGYIEVFENRNAERIKKLPTQGLIKNEEFIKLLLKREINSALWGILFRKDLLIQFEMPIFKVGEDLVYLFLLAYNVKSVYLLNVSLYSYLQRKSSAVHSTDYQNILDIYCSRKWIFDFLLVKNDTRFTLEANYLLLDGFIEYLLKGGKRWQEETNVDINSICFLIKKKISLWKRLLFFFYWNIPFLVPVWLRILKYIQSMKVWFDCNIRK